MEKKEIKIFRAGRESLEEAVRLVQSTEEKMKEKSWFVAESLEEFDRWMRKDQGWLYVAKDCSSGQLAGPAGDGRRKSGVRYRYAGQAVV